MPEKNPMKFALSSSSESEQEIPDEIVSSSSTILTSFDSQVSGPRSSKKKYLRGKKGDTIVYRSPKRKSGGRVSPKRKSYGRVSPKRKSGGRVISSKKSIIGKRQTPSTSGKKNHGGRLKKVPIAQAHSPRKDRNKPPSHVKKKRPGIDVTKSSLEKIKVGSSHRNQGHQGRSSTSYHRRPPRDSDDYESDNESEGVSNSVSNSEGRNQIVPSTSKGPPIVRAGAPHRKRGRPRKNRVIAEIKKYQSETRLLLAKLPFARTVREITEARTRGLRWQVAGLQAMQEAAEIYLVHLFEDSVLCTIHRSRLTLNVADMRLARRIRSRFEDF